MDYYRSKVVFITGAASGIGRELARQLVGLSRSPRLEGRASRVKVTAVCPGFIETPLFANAETAPGVDKSTHALLA